MQLVGLVQEAEEKENLTVPEKPLVGEIDQKVMQGILNRFQITTEPKGATR